MEGLCPPYTPPSERGGGSMIEMHNIYPCTFVGAKSIIRLEGPLTVSHPGIIWSSTLASASWLIWFRSLFDVSVTIFFLGWGCQPRAKPGGPGSTICLEPSTCCFMTGLILSSLEK